MRTFLLLTIFISTLNSDYSSELKLDKSRSSMSIIGTSSLHDWESKVNDFSLTGTINESTLSDIKVEVVTNSIESGRSIMNKKTFDALMAEEFPLIVFEASQLKINDDEVQGEGIVTIVGQSKSIPIKASIGMQTSSELYVIGEVKLKMTEFGIDPPTAMFGTLKTGDDITIKYELLLTK